MVTVYGKGLTITINSLESAGKTLYGIKAAMERSAGTVVDDYFGVLVALRGIGEVIDRLVRIVQKEKEE